MRDDVAPDERLLAVCDADELDADLQRQLALVMEIFNGLGTFLQVERIIPRSCRLFPRRAMSPPLPAFEGS